MIDDRGNMKWTSLMLPEHLDKLKEWKKEQFYDTKRVLTEWEFDEIEQIIQRSYKMKEQVKLTIWSNNKLYDVIGIITGTDILNKELLIETDISIKRITFDQLQKAMMVNSDD
ncbi:YolD-like family protein [Lysinibacillus sp. NPDC093712]|uniref:YolD-like family protein n=1 Tax=Lysinibacillus sp. NPDC093712 TaxID=3390579 RepID=UPI003D039421